MPSKKMFFAHSIKSTKKDLKKMYLNFMCSDAAESSIERQSATESYCVLKKMLEKIKK
jgi:hypothetical protein